MRLRPVAMRDVRSFALTDPSPSRGCLCKTVADKRGDPRRMEARWNHLTRQKRQLHIGGGVAAQGAAGW